MNRRDFFRIAGYGLLGAMFPGIQKGIDDMPISNILMKMADDQPLSSGEKDELRRWASRTEMANAYVSGLDTAGVSPNVDGLSARRLEVRDRMLIGSALSGKPNLYYDAAAGALQFRTGTTVNSYVDSDGEFFSFALLYSNTLTDAAATLASIQIPSAYSQIMLVGATRSAYSGANANDVVVCRLNGDSGANYDGGQIAQLSGASFVAEGLGSTKLNIAYCPVSTSPAGSYGGLWAFIGNLNGGGWKNSFALCGARLDDPGAPATMSSFLYDVWRSTAAVTSVAVTLNSGQNFVAGSHISIYGLR